jgi:hypothetical protein
MQRPAGGQLLFETPVLRGLAMVRRAERGFLLKSYFFRWRAFYGSDHSVVRN